MSARTMRTPEKRNRKMEASRVRVGARVVRAPKQTAFTRRPKGGLGKQRLQGPHKRDGKL